MVNYKLNIWKHLVQGLLVAFVCCATSCKETKQTFDYFGQSRAGLNAEPFHIEKEYLNRGFLIDPMAEYIIFGAKTGEEWYHSKLMFIKKKNGTWTTPDTLSFSKAYYCIEPCFSPDGNTLLFSSNRTSASGKGKTLSIWKSNRTKQGWSEPTQLDSTKINFNDWTLGAQWTENNRLYFFTRKPGLPYSFYVANWDGLSFSESTPVDVPIHTISGYTTWNLLVAPDESYMIFPSERTGTYEGQNPYARMDLFVAFNRNNQWSNPKPLHSLNTLGFDYPVTISPDRKHFFYTANDTLYWSGTEFLDTLKSQNFNPYLKNQLPDYKVDLKDTTRISLPLDYFIDDDHDPLNFEISQSNGDKLPDWISFDRQKGSLSCMPIQSETIILNIKAEDPYGGSANGKICITTSDQNTKLVKGLNFRFYDDSIESIEVLKDLKPSRHGISRSVKPFYQQTQQEFGMTYEGFINIPEDGDYTFDFMLAPTSNLSLNLNQNEILSYEKRKATVGLRKGLVTFVLKVTFKDGKNWFLPQMESSEIPKNIIDADLLFSRVE